MCAVYCAAKHTRPVHERQCFLLLFNCAHTQHCSWFNKQKFSLSLFLNTQINVQLYACARHWNKYLSILLCRVLLCLTHTLPLYMLLFLLTEVLNEKSVRKQMLFKYYYSHLLFSMYIHTLLCIYNKTSLTFFAMSVVNQFGCCCFEYYC